MGAVSIDIEKKSRSLDEKYKLYQASGVKKVISNYFHIEERAYSGGDFDGAVLLIDLETAMEQAHLGKRQKEVIQLFKYGYTHEEIGQLLNIERKTVTHTLTQSCRKISEIYTKWNYLDELIA